ncbi:MAG: YdcF family protein [Gammaproteobacteria bacterium]|nr:YdcF family protein [Gammaproteobacteria bacterium]
MDYSFILKKFISTSLMPLSVFLILFFIGLFLLWGKQYKKTAKVLITIAFIWFYLISFYPVSNALLMPIERTYLKFEQNNYQKDISYIIVLGHSSKEDNFLPLSSQLTPVTVVRLVEGIRIYRQYSGSKLIFSGGKTKEKGSHPLRVKNMAVALGVPEKDIILIEGPKDTFDEAVAIAPIVKNSSSVLVTSASHMKRSIALFSGQGVAPIPAPTYFRAKKESNFSILSFFPSYSAIEKTQLAIHEYLGIIWSKLIGNI